MLARKTLLAGNWKMHKTPEETELFIRGLLSLLTPREDAEVAIFPPSTSLDRAGHLLAGTGIQLGAQNLYFEPYGAFTGEVSAAMLRACGCSYVLVGHSERRALFREDDTLVNRKLKAAATAGLAPILCIGETRSERRGGRTEERVLSQLSGALVGVSPAVVETLVLAYEPIWAIGTGEPASPESADEVAHRIRDWLAAVYGKTSERVRILYGGSVTPENILPLLSRPDLDGTLIGGASLAPEAMAKMAALVPKSA